MSIFNQAAGAYTSGVQGMDAGQQTLYGAGGQTGGNPYMQEAAGIYGQTAGAPIVQQTMNQYLNPYKDQVVNSTVDRMRDERNNQLNQVRGQAAQAGAFGGARQGLVESQVYDNSQQNIGNAIGQMNNQGFMQAAQLGQSRIGQMQNAGQGFAGLGAQGDAYDMQLNQLDMQNRQMGMQAAQGQLGAAQQGLNMGNTINQNQMQAGSQQQALNQQVLGQANDQYGQYANQPGQSLQMLLAGLTGNPLSQNTTTTQTSTPGLLDYLSQAAGLGSSYMMGS